MNIDQAVYWITEREAIRKRRAAGQPAPWTTDPILAAYRFCNVWREDDAVTSHIGWTWRDPYRDDPHLWFAMTVARLINWPDTLDELGYPVPWDREHFRRVLCSRMQRGHVTFGSAYVIPNGGSSKPKVDYIADNVLHRLWRSREHMSPQRGITLVAYAARLQDFNGIGGFIAGQVVADLKYVEPLRSAADWMTFAVSGPGSRRGLNRIMGRPVDTAWTEATWQAAFRQFEAAIRPELQRIGLADLHCQDLQNCLCEIDKYLRGTLGEGKPKRRFAGR
jgi:alpha-glutamyl/putrescinyl thymine pyrophosphorylase clade 1